MDTIWDVPLPQERTNVATVIRLIRDRFYSFVAVLAIGFLLMLSLVLNAWVVAMRIAVPRGATFTITFVLVAVLFAALYMIVPDVKLKWSNVALGAGITSLLFMMGNQLMALYFPHAKFGST
jgi:membrane protein